MDTSKKTMLCLMGAIFILIGFFIQCGGSTANISSATTAELMQDLKVATKYKKMTAIVLELGNRNVTEAVDLLIKKLGDHTISLDPEAWEFAATTVSVLGNLGDQKAVPQIILAYRHGKAMVRYAAVEALGKLGTGLSVKTLIEAQSDPDPSVRQIAAKTLEQLKQNAGLMYQSGGGSSAAAQGSGAGLNTSDGPKLTVVSPESTYALVIGLRYSGNPFPIVENGVADARAFYAKLLEVGVPQDNIWGIFDEEATVDTIITHINLLYARVQDDPNGKTIFYFAGHGSPRIEDGEVKSGYLVAYDSSPNNLARFSINMDTDLLEKARLSKKPALLFLDACFSGASAIPPDGSSRLALGEVGKPEFLEESNENSNVPICVVTSSSENEMSYGHPDESIHQGLFTYYLLEALSGKVVQEGQPVVSIKQLAQYIQSKVKDKAMVFGKSQQPTYQFNGWNEDEPILLVGE